MILLEVMQKIPKDYKSNSGEGIASPILITQVQFIPMETKKFGYC